MRELFETIEPNSNQIPGGRVRKNAYNKSP